MGYLLTGVFDPEEENLGTARSGKAPQIQRRIGKRRHDSHDAGDQGGYPVRGVDGLARCSSYAPWSGTETVAGHQASYDFYPAINTLSQFFLRDIQLTRS